MTRDEVEFAIDLAAEEGWNPGIHDGDCLFAALKSHVPGESIFLDTPEVNPAAVELAERYHMRVVFQTVRMYSREEPSIPLSRTFGVTTFELG
jgi:hypothetical protein